MSKILPQLLSLSMPYPIEADMIADAITNMNTPVGFLTTEKRWNERTEIIVANPMVNSIRPTDFVHILRNLSDTISPRLFMTFKLYHIATKKAISHKHNVLAR